MKKCVFLALLACLVGPSLMADEANVLPAGVVRLRLVPSYSTVDQAYGKDGASADADAKGTIFTASGALELGLLESVTAGLKWAPGYNAQSQFTTEPSALKAVKANTKLNANGPADLEVGAKVQVLGPKGFVKADAFRLALTPGFSLPLDQYDAKTEADNFLAGKDYRASSSSGHSSMGYGLKADADWLVSDQFLINLHGQAFQYQPAESVAFGTYVSNKATAAFLYQSPVLKDGVTANPYQGNAAGAQAAANASYPLTNTKITYGQEYSFEVEPHFTLPLGDANNLGFGLPVVFDYRTEVTTSYKNADTKADPTQLLTLKPHLTCFVVVGPLPVELQAEYDVPVYGKARNAVNTAVVQLKLFAKLY